MLCIRAGLCQTKPVRKTEKESQPVSASHVKAHHTIAMKTKSAKAHRRTTPLKSATMPLNTAVNHAVSKEKDGKERILPRI